MGSGSVVHSKTAENHGVKFSGTFRMAPWNSLHEICRMGFTVWDLQYGICRMGFTVWDLQYGICRMGFTV